MAALTWANLINEADEIDGPARTWTDDERREWQDWMDVWDHRDNPTSERILALKTAEWLEELFDAGTPYKSLTGLYLWVYHQVSRECGMPSTIQYVIGEDYDPFLVEDPKPELTWENLADGTYPTELLVAKTQPVEDTAQEPPLYAEDAFSIDWSQPVIFRGESRNGDGRLFYLHVPWEIVPGNRLRSFLRENVGIAKGYKGMNGFKLGGQKYFRTLPLMGQVNKQPVSYIDSTIEALLASGADMVQERRVVNTEELCTGSCQGANSWTPCECICGGDGHGGGSVLPGAEYTVYRGDLIIEGKREIVWKIYE